MRRIFAILLIIFVGFWIVYGIVPGVKANVDSWVLNTAGPTVYNGLQTAYTGLINTLGVSGFSALVLIVGVFSGFMIHRLWVKTDWRIRRWGTSRIRKDLGIAPVTPIPSTPVGATTRPQTSTTASTPSQTTTTVSVEKPEQPEEETSTE